MVRDYLMSYHYLVITILAEVVATTALKATEDFTKLIPTLIVIIGYCVAFYFFSLCIKTMPVGVAYALWSGLGIVLVALVTAIFYQQIPDWPSIMGIGLIISGVAIIQLFSETASS